MKCPNFIKEAASHKHEYSFVGAYFPKGNQVIKNIMKFVNSIPQEDLYIDPKDPSYGRETRPHITIKYGLHTNKFEDVKKLLSNFYAFKIKLGELHTFHRDDYDVLKINVVDSPELKKMNKIISDNLKCTDTFSGYHPHVTIAYLKKGKGQQYRTPQNFENKTIMLNTITFANQQGKENNLKLSFKIPREIQKQALSKFKQLKKHQVPLTPEERALVMKRKAVWHFTLPDHHATPAVWKSINPKTNKVTYITNTHRAYNTAPSVKGAISRYHKFIKGTA